MRFAGPEANGSFGEVDFIPSQSHDLVHPGQGVVEGGEKRSVVPGGHEDAVHLFFGGDETPEFWFRCAFQSFRLAIPLFSASYSNFSENPAGCRYIP